MQNYDVNVFASYLLKGKLRDGLEYMKKFSNNNDLVSRYYDVFQNGMKESRTSNTFVNDVINIYNDYFIDLFWRDVSVEEADIKLFKHMNDYLGASNDYEHYCQIENDLKERFNQEGYQFLGGKTDGYYGPYIWEKTYKETYYVELPSRTEQFSVKMMEGFIARSWLDFLSFGRIGTGGWIDEDGTLCCISSSYDTESDNFKISFLKHEAQHSFDKRVFPNMTDVELEYRAKLVELIYWEDDKIIKMIHLDADSSNSSNSHSLASHRIIADLSKKMFGVDYEVTIDRFFNKTKCIQSVAMTLLEEDTQSRIAI